VARCPVTVTDAVTSPNDRDREPERLRPSENLNVTPSESAPLAWLCTTAGPTRGDPATPGPGNLKLAGRPWLSAGHSLSISPAGRGFAAGPRAESLDSAFIFRPKGVTTAFSFQCELRASRDHDGSVSAKAAAAARVIPWIALRP
jgi:hypothetical protein